MRRGRGTGCTAQQTAGGGLPGQGEAGADSNTRPRPQPDTLYHAARSSLRLPAPACPADIISRLQNFTHQNRVKCLLMAIAANHLSDEEIGGLRKVRPLVLPCVTLYSTITRVLSMRVWIELRVGCQERGGRSAKARLPPCPTAAANHAALPRPSPPLPSLQIFHFIDADADGEISMHDLGVALQHAGLDMEQQGMVALLRGLDLAHQGTVGGWTAGGAVAPARGCSPSTALGDAAPWPACVERSACAALAGSARSCQPQGALAHANQSSLRRPLPQVSVEFIAAALDQRKVLTAKTVNSIFCEFVVCCCYHCRVSWCYGRCCHHIRCAASVAEAAASAAAAAAASVVGAVVAAAASAAGAASQ